MARKRDIMDDPPIFFDISQMNSGMAQTIPERRVIPKAIFNIIAVYDKQ